MAASRELITDPERLEAKAVRDLANWRKRDDIILELCELSGRSWDEMAALVRSIELNNQGKIMARRKPLYRVVAIITTIVGIAASVGIVLLTLDGLIIFFIFLPIPFLGNIAVFLFGLGMTIGGIRGIGEQFFNRQASA